MRYFLPAILLLTACADDDATAVTAPPPPPAACAPGEIELTDGVCLPAGTIPGGCEAGQLAMEDGSCLDAGTQPSGCAAGELTLDDGSCQAAGVPAADCGNGFESTGDGGCDPILPAQRCTTGMLALMGETTCRALVACGTAPWGDIPVDGTTQYVDASYIGGNNDGGSAAPWTTIQQGIDSATDGAIIAVAAGSYAESVRISAKSVRLWGRCPALVELANTTADTAAVAVESGADMTEIHSLAVSGAGRGIDVSASENVLLDGVWIHDTEGYGVNAFDEPPASTTLTLRNVLVEAATEQGIWIEGAEAVIEDSSVRDGRAINGNFGWGIAVLEDEVTFKHATLALRRTLVENNLEVGVIAHASDISIEEVVVRDTTPSASGRLGRGIVAQTAPPSTLPTNMTARATVVTHNADGGFVVAASNLVAEAVTIRDVSVRTDTGDRGYGIAGQHDPSTGAPSNLQVRSSLIEEASEMGLFFAGASGSAEGVLIRGSRSIDSGIFGRGMSIQTEPVFTIRPNVEVRGCLLESNHEMGIMVLGATALIEGTLIRDHLPLPDGTMGWGLGVQDQVETGERADVTLRYSVLDNNVSVGAFIAGSDALLQATVFSNTQPQLAGGIFGRGINIQDNEVTGQRSDVEVESCVVSYSFEHGIFAAGADAIIRASVVRATAPQMLTQMAGRGVGIQVDLLSGARPNVQLIGSLVEDNHDAGVFVAGGDLHLESTLIRGTLADANGLFGDGVVFAHVGDGTTGAIVGSRIEDNTRAGVANFGGNISLDSSRVVCNQIDLTGESFSGVESFYADEGNNTCGCSTDPCKVLSVNLEAPSAFGEAVPR